jgi:hypothetical protein
MVTLRGSMHGQRGIQSVYCPIGGRRRIGDECVQLHCDAPFGSIA